MKRFNLRSYDINVETILRNASPAVLCEEAIRRGGGVLAANGALMADSGNRTGRSPKDKRIVDHPDSADDIWWGKTNIALSEESFLENRRLAIQYLNTQQRLYVVDGFAGWSPIHRLKVRVICSLPYHALFMRNMLVRPAAEELGDFGEPDFTIFNAGARKADPSVEGVGSETSVGIFFESGEFVILGTEYAGEMKKGVFTVMNYLMPKAGALSMHCSANEGERGDVSLFFGLSGTGKTTLSHDPGRRLIGDDEHYWSDDGIFNIEGGCYAKCLDLDAAKEPEIWSAIRFGAVLENVVADPQTREVDYRDASLTQNTRACYPIEHIPGAKIPCSSRAPSNIVFLTCDAFGVLPPVSRLDSDQAKYHFISGYTARVAGTEQGVTEPEAVFSACFGGPFLVWHPMKYAEALAERAAACGTRFWLINTGWTGGGHGVGKRIDLSHTRAIVAAIHDGSLIESEFRTDPVFGLAVPQKCRGIPDRLLDPRATWSDPAAYDRQARHLAGLFEENHRQFEELPAEPDLAEAKG